MRSRSARVILGLAVVLLVRGPVTVAPASAYSMEITPAEICFGDLSASMAVIESRLTPAEGATVVGGAPVDFSAKTTEPLSFEVAASPQLLLAGSYLASGPGLFGAGEVETFTLAVPPLGSLYWRISWSTRGDAECAKAAEEEGLSEPPLMDWTSPARLLTVLPPAEPAPVTSTQSPSPSSEQSEEPPLGRIYSIADPRVIRGGVAFGVRCYASCTGTVSYRILIRTRDGKVRVVRQLASGPKRVTISNPSGGSEAIVDHYPRTLGRRLAELLRAGHVTISVAAELESGGSHERGQTAQELRTSSKPT